MRLTLGLPRGGRSLVSAPVQGTLGESPISAAEAMIVPVSASWSERKSRLLRCCDSCLFPFATVAIEGRQNRCSGVPRTATRTANPFPGRPTRPWGREAQIQGGMGDELPGYDRQRQEIGLLRPLRVRAIHDGWSGVEKSGHDDENLHAFDAEAESWAERERERDLMAVLIEAAHLKSAARAWYRRRDPRLLTRRKPRLDA
jgi:hypothetical protein